MVQYSHGLPYFNIVMAQHSQYIKCIPIWSWSNIFQHSHVPITSILHVSLHMCIWKADIRIKWGTWSQLLIICCSINRSYSVTFTGSSVPFSPHGGHWHQNQIDPFIHWFCLSATMWSQNAASFAIFKWGWLFQWLLWDWHCIVHVGWWNWPWFTERASLNIVLPDHNNSPHHNAVIQDLKLYSAKCSLFLMGSET